MYSNCCKEDTVGAKSKRSSAYKIILKQNQCHKRKLLCSRLQASTRSTTENLATASHRWWGLWHCCDLIASHDHLRGDRYDPRRSDAAVSEWSVKSTPFSRSFVFTLITTSGNWATRGYANSRTGQDADWTTRRLAVAAKRTTRTHQEMR